MQRSTSVLLVVLPAAMLACAVPGALFPAADSSFPNTLSTIIVSTANAAASQTAEAQPPGGEQELGTAGPERTGTSIEQLADGTTRYDDYDAGFEITYPAGWLAVRLNSDEFNAALVTTGDNSMLYDKMTSDLADFDAATDRVYAYILRPDLQEDVMYGYSHLEWNPLDTAPLDDAAMGKMMRELEASGVLPGFRADTAQVRANANGVMTVEIGGRFSINNDEGEIMPFYVSYLIFKPSPTSISRITFAFVDNFNDQISPDVRAIVESIRLH